MTGIATGPIMLDVELCDRADGGRDPGGWEDLFRGEMDIFEPLYLFAPTIDAGVPDAVFAPNAPGTHGLQVLARGRGSHYDHVVENPVEAYLLRFWPL